MNEIFRIYETNNILKYSHLIISIETIECSDIYMTTTSIVFIVSQILSIIAIILHI